jgi:hypothetical protein
MLRGVEGYVAHPDADSQDPYKYDSYGVRMEFGNKVNTYTRNEEGCKVLTIPPDKVHLSLCSCGL